MQNQEKTEKKYTFCRICESLCGLEVTMQGNEIVKIMPDNDHVATRGFACPKGLKQHHLFNSPDRLKYPMARRGDTWKRVSWDTANAEIGQKVRQILDEHGPDSIAMYVGTAAGFGVLHPVFAQGFMDGLGSGKMFASASQDCSNKFAVADEMYGFPFTQPFPDLYHTNCMIVVGANPVVSKWSFLQVPNPSLHLKEMERRGAKIFWIDPRKTESAKVAGEHVFIRPNTDVWFMLSLLNEIIQQGGIRLEGNEKYFEGLEMLVNLAKQWPSTRTETLTGISPETIQYLAKTYLEADGACIYSSTGLNMGTHGSLAFWIKESINAVTGNLDRKGGTLVGMGITDFPKFGKKNGLLTKKDPSRIGPYRKTNDAYPGGLLADEILTPGEGQVKALFVTGGNPLITMTNSNRMRKAFDQLELLVTLDILPNETGTIGHYMLPCTSPLERPDLPFIFPLMLGLQAKPYLQATEALVVPDGEQRDEGTIYFDLAEAAGIPILGSKIAHGLLKLSRKKRTHGQPAIAQRFLLNAILRITRQKGFKGLLKKPHGILRPDHEPGSFLGKRVYTDNGKVNLAPNRLMEAAHNLEKDNQAAIHSKEGLLLITKRAVTTHNSWTHNFEDFVKGERQTNYLYIHKIDAEERGLQQGDLVDVQSKTGKVRLPIKILNDLMPGTVALPHGWGHQATLMNVAKSTKGVNVNILAADGPEALERISGMAHLTGISVEVTPAAGPLVENSWSGLEEDVWRNYQVEA